MLLASGIDRPVTTRPAVGGRVIVGLFAAFALSALAGGPDQTAAAPWSAPATLSTDEELVARPIEFAHESNGRGDAVVVWTADLEGRRVVRASTRELGGPWSPPASISDGPAGSVTRSVAADIDERGNALVAWSRQVGEGSVVEASARPAARGRWMPPEAISPALIAARTAPRLVLDRAGNATALWAGAGEGGDLIGGARRSAGSGEWSTSAPGTPMPGVLSTPDLSVAPDGRVLASWRNFPDEVTATSAWSATAVAGGEWSPPVEMDLPIGVGADGRTIVGAPRTAITREGDAIALFQEPPDGPGEPWRILFAEAQATGPWSEFVPLAGQPRSGEVTPAVPMPGGDGSAFAAWSVRASPPSGGGPRSRALVARRPAGGGWESPVTLSDPRIASPGAIVAVNAAGAALVIFRELRGATHRAVARRWDPSVGNWSPAEEVVRFDPRRPLVNASATVLRGDGGASYLWIDQLRRVRVVDRARGEQGTIRFSRRQLLINQRISQAALRRATAALERVRSGLTGADLRDGALGSEAFADDLDVTGAEVGSFAGPGGGRPVVLGVPDREGGTVTLSPVQLRINQRISQAALRRSAALARGLRRGLLGAHFAKGSLTADDIAPGLSVEGTGRSATPAVPDQFRVPPPGARRGSAVRLTRVQLEINQRIAQEAVRRANAVVARLEAGLTGADIRPGGITSAAVALSSSG